MENLVLVVHVLAALGVIGLVLLQHGKGADMGASFGSGASGSLFGASGSANFMSRATAWCVAVFFVTSITLAYFSGHQAKGSSVIKLPVATQAATPKADAATGTTEIPKDAAPKAKDVPQ